ncbi:MAG: cation transporter [Deltaproteobacteria bacterium]|nr:cation transporter [Deltaproteobacteria bacterium]
MTDPCAGSRDPNFQARRITLIGVAVNLFLFLLKFCVGIWGHSQAVVADAVHSLSDLGTDFIVLIGVRYWNAPPDDHHPYGHKRLETLAAILIGGLLGAVACALIGKALNCGGESVGPAVSLYAVVGPLASILAKEILFRATLKVGRRIDSRAVIANAYHHRSDVLSSIPALIAVCLSAASPALAYVDKIGSLVVSGFILKAAYDIIKPNITELLDTASYEDHGRIKAEVLKIEGVRDAHRIRTRTHGGALLVDLHVLVDPQLTVAAGHEISEQVKKRLLARNKKIIDVVVHLEPYQEESRDFS